MIVDEAPHLYEAQLQSQQNQTVYIRLIISGLANFGLHLGVVHDSCITQLGRQFPRPLDWQRTILKLAYARLEVIKREIAHGVFEIVQIHDG